MLGTDHQFDVAIVGGGILGLAHAWAAAELGERVIVFERQHRAMGASIRNFGMIWPIGQPAGELHEMAIRSRARWLQLGASANVWVRQCGSLHLAFAADEMAVLEEFVQGHSFYPGLRLLSPAEVAQQTNAVNQNGLLGAIYSETELCVNPRDAIGQLASWLAAEHSVTFRFGTTVREIDHENELTTTSGESFRAERTVVCSGSDFETLFPQAFRESGLRKCKLQMLSTGPQPSSWSWGPHIAGGLTLRHYASFAACPSLEKLKQRIAEEQPLFDQFGIHVMAAMNDCRELILGDSHVYDEHISPFDNTKIDELIVAELAKMLSIPLGTIERRWHGVYAKHPEQTMLRIDVAPNCKLVTAPGGAGMTLSFGFAEQTWQQWT